jgi:hypothetical protein
MHVCVWAMVGGRGLGESQFENPLGARAKRTLLVKVAKGTCSLALQTRFTHQYVAGCPSRPIGSSL